MNKCKSFPSVINQNSKVLILGSMPGVKSLEEQQYYAHPQNRFWKIMSLLCKCDNLHAMPYETGLEILLKNNFALWDVIKFCERKGSMDTDIRNERPNELDTLLEKYPNIEKICFNGTKAYMAFKKYFPDYLSKYKHFKLPSTSPANAKFKTEDLFIEWSLAINS